MTQVEITKIKIRNTVHEFYEGTYNGMAVIYDKHNGFINASSFVSQFGKDYHGMIKTKGAKEFIAGFERRYYKNSTSEDLPMWSATLNGGIPDCQKRFRGTYVDPRMLNYLAFRCNPEYALDVGEVMDAINKRVHDELEKAKLPDEPKHAEPMFKNVVVSFIDEANRRGQRAYENQYCWGCRD